MNIGMLWFDNDPKSDLKIKLNRAILYYRNKYGQDPNLCFVHPSMINGAETEVRATREGPLDGAFQGPCQWPI